MAAQQSNSPILSPADLKFFELNGYVVARGAISREQAAVAVGRDCHFDDAPSPSCILKNLLQGEGGAAE